MLDAIRTKYDGSVPSEHGLNRREFNWILREAWHEAGKYWHRELRAKHFTREGAREYGYVSRAGDDLPRNSKAFRRSYTGRKLKKFGHTKPLVFSGESERRTRSANVVATSQGVKVRMNAPALNFRNKHSQANPALELRTISKAEGETIAKRVLEPAIRDGIIHTRRVNRIFRNHG